MRTQRVRSSSKVRLYSNTRTSMADGDENWRSRNTFITAGAPGGVQETPHPAHALPHGIWVFCGCGPTRSGRGALFRGQCRRGPTWRLWNVRTAVAGMSAQAEREKTWTAARDQIGRAHV